MTWTLLLSGGAACGAVCGAVCGAECVAYCVASCVWAPDPHRGPWAEGGLDRMAKGAWPHPRFVIRSVFRYAFVSSGSAVGCLAWLSACARSRGVSDLSLRW